MNAVVVGGGISGIFASLLLRKKYENVYLIEVEPEIGGLYRSHEIDEEVTFDLGCHYVRTTGIEEVDSLAFRDIKHETWHMQDRLNVGCFFGGSMDGDTSYADLRKLPQDVYEKVIFDILHSGPKNIEFKNAEEQLRNIYGETLYTKVLRPTLEEKFYGRSLSELSPNVHQLFGFPRFKALTQETTREIKRSPVFDWIFAFHSADEGKSGRLNCYPKRGGIVEWIKSLKKQLQEANVQILTGARAKSALIENSEIREITLADDRKIECKEVFWTAHLPALLQLAQLPYELPGKPDSLYTSLHHFIFDEYASDLSIVQCLDKDMLNFRITLYGNVQKIEGRTRFPITSEVISPKSLNNEEVRIKLVQEYKKMGLISEKNTVLHEQSEILPYGFPCPTLKYREDKDKLRSYLLDSLKNIHLLGRHGTHKHATPELLKDIYEKLY